MLLRFSKENRKLVALSLIIYIVGTLFVYGRYWRNSIIDDDDESVSVFDIHLEDSVLGHTGEVIGDHTSVTTLNANQTRVVIAIGGGITSRGIKGFNASSNFTAKFPFFKTLLPTFCMTACANFTYRFYLAYDQNDRVFANGQLAAEFQRTFAVQTQKLCLESKGVRTSLHLVQCSHAGKPTWAQNDAMMEAYIDHVDYFYRINDDTRYTLLLSVCKVHLRWVKSKISTFQMQSYNYLRAIQNNLLEARLRARTVPTSRDGSRSFMYVVRYNATYTNFNVVISHVVSVFIVFHTSN